MLFRSIAAPSSTKNAAGARDPEMHQTRKGKDWHFGMKLHIGADRQGLVHSLTATHAAVADITQLPYLLHGRERTLHGDQAYWSEGDRQGWTASGGEYLVNRRGTRSRPLTGRQRLANRHRSRARARGEHPFQVIKHLWGFTKVRFRGVAKNLARAYTLFGLANLYRVRKRLLPRGFVPCFA